MFVEKTNGEECAIALEKTKMAERAKRGGAVVARQVHHLEASGSIPLPATMLKNE